MHSLAELIELSLMYTKKTQYRIQLAKLVLSRGFISHFERMELKWACKGLAKLFKTSFFVIPRNWGAPQTLRCTQRDKFETPNHRYEKWNGS